MSILGGLFRQSAESDLRNPTAWLLDAFAGRRTASGMNVTPESVLTLPVYYAAIRNIAEDVGKTPLHLYRRDGRVQNHASDDPLYSLLHDAPNPEMSAMSFRETITHWALGWKAGFAEIERDGAGVRSLWPIHPSRVRIHRDPETGGLFWRVRSTWTDEAGAKRMEDVDIPDADMLVIHGLGSDGLLGYSVMQLASEAIGLGLAQQRYGANFYGSGASSMMVMTTTAKPSPEVKQKMRDDWIETYNGPDASRVPLIFGPDTKFERLDVNPEEAQAIESRQFQVADLARVLRMPLSKINSGSAAASEREAIDYVVDTLTPWYTRWEQEVARKCIRPSERGSMYARHQVQGLMRGDHAARANFYSTLHGRGIFSINEIRGWEELNPVEGGDTHFVPMNTIPLQSAEAFANSQIQKQMEANQASRRNPTDMGGGADKEPDDNSSPARQMEARVIAMGFLSPLTQRLACKEAKAFEAAAKKAPAAFAAWATDYYHKAVDEAFDMLAEPIAAYARLTGRECRPNLAGWFANQKRLATDAFVAGKVVERVEALTVSVGPDMAKMLTEAI